MKTIILYLICIVSVIIGIRIYHLTKDKNYYGWPAVTVCRICNKTVWEWQSYERRDFTVQRNSNIVVSASGLVHTKCEGHPNFEVSIEIK
jgi:hypothetical protein